MNIFSVSEITKYIKQLFEYDSKVASVMVRGEISNFKKTLLWALLLYS
jgi:exodeoxyribonuclease VII large subunit